MAGITQEIPNYGVGGISQQPDQLKRPGQVKDAVNVIPDVIYGLYKRPGAERIGTSKLSDVQTNGSYFHYHRDEDEGNYIGQVASDGSVRIWSCTDGLEKTVSYHANPWEGSTAYVVNDLVMLGGKIYICTVAGTSASSGGPTGTGTGITDGGVTWNYSTTESSVTTAIKSYLTPSSATATEDIQALTINDTTFLNNRTKTVGTTGTTDAYAHPKGKFAYIDLLRTENGRQYGLNLYSEETATTQKRATKIQITADDLYTGGGSGSCNGIGTQVFTVTAAGSYSSTPEIVEVKNSSGSVVTSGKDNLVFRITVNGQQGWQQMTGFAYGSSATSLDYKCSYRKEIVLLHGGEGWETGDTCKVEATAITTGGSRTGGTSFPHGGYTRYNNDGLATYTIKVLEHEEFDVKGTINSGVNGIIRPSPTPFDADTAVTADTILGGIQAAISGSGVTGVIIGNGLYLSSSSDFSLEAVDLDLMRVMTHTIDDITKLPVQCKDGYIIKVANTRMSDEDDYWLKFEGQNGKDGAGTWTECAEPGIVKGWDADTMPHVLQRQANGTFLVKKFTWADRAVGDDNTNPFPSFNGKKINRMLSFANRLAVLAGENVTLSRPATFGEPNFFADTALTVSVIDPIDISSSSKYPADLFDGIETTTGLVVFSTNQQFLLSSDAEQLTAETAKLRAVSAFNYNKVVPPLYLGTSIAWLDNSNKYSRFVECADIAREGEPTVQETSKLVPTLLPKEINLVAESRDNSILLFGKTGDDTVIGFSYYNTAKERQQASWFKWKHNEKLLYHFIVNDEYFFLDEDHFLQKINLIQGSDDPSIDQTDLGVSTNFLLHLDNWTTIYGGVYNSTTKVTTFTHGTAGCVFNWQSDIPDPNGDLVLVDINTDSTRIGRYTTATVTGAGAHFTVPGNWDYNVQHDIVHTAINASNEQITLTSHGLSTGDLVRWVEGDSAAGGLTDGNSYYVIKASDNNIALASSLSNANAGVAVNITSQGTGTHKIQKRITDLYIGYLYEYSVKFPRIYRLSIEGQNVRADTRASLIIHRLKLNFGKVGLYATTLDRVGKLQYTDTYESSDLDEYNVDDAPYLNRKIKTIPVYEKNENVTVTLKSSHPAPATLYSMAWEGSYSPKLYNRA